MDREQLASLVARGMTVREIAATAGVHRSTVTRWLTQHGLRTERRRRSEVVGERAELHCRVHGTTTFGRKREGGWRCLRCRSEAVSRRRRRVKELLIAEAGGSCAICGYSRCPAALEFHHPRPADKRFTIAGRGVTRSLREAREEAKKCVLLCSNCHAEVEAGIRPLQAKQGPADYRAESIPG